jgi:hypothetical protein
MGTVAELQEQIAAAQHKLQEARRAREEIKRETVEALERQRLRRILDGVKEEINEQLSENSVGAWWRGKIDRDEAGDHQPAAGSQHSRPEARVAGKNVRPMGEVIDWSKCVDQREFVWKIHGMSWLENGLEQTFREEMVSEEFKVGSETFDLVYMPQPDRGTIGVGHTGGWQQRGSLAIRHLEKNGITFRYRIFIKKAEHAGGDFVQWGATGHECHPYWEDRFKVFGPDVQTLQNREEPSFDGVGIFGMTHQSLIDSEFVDNDMLIVKVCLEVRPPCEPIETSMFKHTVDVPEPTLSANLLALLDSGEGSDVTFIVEGQKLKAHSQILCARSEFFDRELHSGLRESTTKEIAIEECSAETFSAVLRFLYSDDFGPVDQIIMAGRHDAASSSRENSEHCSKSSELQRLLAVSHKYQVSRLLLWCEQQLCDCISVKEVCSILCKAHLYEAIQLEQACLTYIRDNIKMVGVTPAFGRMSADWPQVMLKVNIFMAGISQEKAVLAVEASDQSLRKRNAPVDSAEEAENETIGSCIAKRQRAD